MVVPMIVSAVAAILIASTSAATAVRLTEAQLKRDVAAQRADFRREAYIRFNSLAVQIVTEGVMITLSSDQPKQDRRYQAWQASTIDALNWRSRLVSSDLSTFRARLSRLPVRRAIWWMPSKRLHPRTTLTLLQGSPSRCTTSNSEPPTR